MANKLSSFILFLSLCSSFYASANNAFCKLTVNGGVGINGECTYDEKTGEFTDGLLKTACRTGMETCAPEDQEVIRGGTFGYIKLKGDSWEFCWNEGGYVKMNECFEGLRQERSCWMVPHKMVFCVDQQ